MELYLACIGSPRIASEMCLSLLLLLRLDSTALVHHVESNVVYPSNTNYSFSSPRLDSTRLTQRHDC